MKFERNCFTREQRRQRRRETQLIAFVIFAILASLALTIHANAGLTGLSASEQLYTALCETHDWE
ncbi:hypothetical protein KQI82_06190 [Oscillibacter sp. MSJ-2]|uniref:Uncharacterized protein n=1 Tax=Dysosmobacter acutus TaxID=2841504 RepID=A0ABS6F893_9FIRM|nr:hypothetical protein [Dysosmobacter acutus]MBU5626508.1 hypothetical protein [Dysosmobacter acutus]